MPRSAIRRRRRCDDDERRQDGSSSSNMLLIVAAILSILRSTDAFRTTTPPLSGQLQSGLSSILSSSSSKQRMDGTMISRASSLYVISNPRRKASSSGKSGLNPGNHNGNSNSSHNHKIISSSVINFEGKKNPLLVDVRKANTFSGSNNPSSLQIPIMASKIAATVQPVMDAREEESSFADRVGGAASASTLFRATNINGKRNGNGNSNGNAFYPSASAIRSQTIAAERNTNDPRPVTTTTQVKTVAELDQFWPECSDNDDDDDVNEECPLPATMDDSGNYDDNSTIDYNQLLKSISIVGDTQIIGSKDHPDFVHPVVQLMHDRKRKQEQEQGEHDPRRRNNNNHNNNNHNNNYHNNYHHYHHGVSQKKKQKIALVVEGGGMRGSVSAGMICAIHCLGLSDTIDVVYGSSAGAVVSAFFVSKQLPYFGPEVYYDALTTMLPNRPKVEEKNNNNKKKKKKKKKGNHHHHHRTQIEVNHAGTTNPNEYDGDPNDDHDDDDDYHVMDRYENDYFIDPKRMTRSIGLGLCDPRLLKDVWTRPLHGKPMMNLRYMFRNIMQNQKPIDFETFLERQKIQPLKVVATGLHSEKPFVLSHENGHFDTLEDLCHSLHASCLLPGIAGPVMNVLKHKHHQKNHKTKNKSKSNNDENNKNSTDKPKFFLRNIQKRRSSISSSSNDDDYEPLADAMLSAPIPYDIAHDEGATHVLVIRSSPDGTNLLKIPSIVAWMGSRIYKRFFLKKNHLPGMYKRSQTEQRHQRIYAKAILELNERTNHPGRRRRRHDRDDGDNDGDDDPQTMTIALAPGSEEVSHLETTREGIFRGVRLGFARAYDALVEDPAMRGRGEEMARRVFPDEILEYDPKLYSSNTTRSAFEEYLESTGTIPKAWKTRQGPPTTA